MKKILVILLVTIMFITLIGCAGNTISFPVNQQPIESEITTESFDDSNNNEVDEESNMATTTSPNQSEGSSTSSSDNSTVPSKIQVIPQETTSSSKPPQEIILDTHNDQPPTNSELPPIAPFDPTSYVTEAIRHGESVGLIHDELYVSKGNWNPWINLNDKLSEAQMMHNIRNSLKILVNEGREYFFVNCEPQGDGSYRMYIYFG